MNQSSLHTHFPLLKSSQKRQRVDEEDSLKKAFKPFPPEVQKLQTLITPISSIPSLSAPTTALITSLNIQKPSNTVEQILTSMPAKQKYAELLSPIRGFPLPYTYKKLLMFLDTLDKSINYCLMSSKSPTVSFLSQFMHEKYNFFFCLDMLAQINSLFKAYSIDIKEKDPQIHISGLQSDQPTSETLSQRKELLHQKLLKITEKSHEDFCSINKLDHNSSTWHPDFDLQFVPTIPKASLEKDPVRSIINSEIVARNAAVGAVFTEMASIPPASPPAPPLFLSPTQPQCSDRLCSITESIKSLFTGMKTPSIFFINLCKKLQITFGDSVSEDLNFICALFPQWLTIIQTNSGKVIRHNRQCTLTLKSMTETIRQALETV